MIGTQRRHRPGIPVLQRARGHKLLQAVLEGNRVEIVQGRLGEYLQIPRPEQPLVPLGAVGRRGKVVAELPVDGVAEQTVHVLVVGLDKPGLLGHRGYRP